MAGFLEGIGRTIGGLQAGILDARMGIQQKHQSFLDKILRGRDENRALQSGAFTQQGLGHSPIMMESLQEGGAAEQISAGRGLLADPRFADNSTELKFANHLMNNVETSQLGQQMMSQIVATQQQQDATVRRQGSTDATELEAAQLAQANKNRDVALAMRDDAVRELGPIAGQIPEFAGALDILATGSPTDAVASIFQFMQTIEPGGIVREGEQQMVRGTGGLTNKLANLINQAEGKGLTLQTRRDIANTMTQIMKPRVMAAQKRQGQLMDAAGLAGLQGTGRNLASGNFGPLDMPGLPESLRVEDLNNPSTVPPGSKPGRAPKPGGNQSVRSIRGR